MSTEKRIKVPRMVLHVGLHKTGTTTIQRSLSKLRSGLRSKGVGLIVHDQWRKLPSEFGWQARRMHKPELADDFTADVHRLVQKEIDDAEVTAPNGFEQLLVSNERISGARMPTQLDHPVFRPQFVPAINQLLDMFDVEEVELVIYTRRQDTFLESCYLWEIQKGASHSIFEQFPFLDEPHFSYTELVERLAAIPRVNSVKVRPFEIISAGSAAYIDDFLSFVGLEGAFNLDKIKAPSHANPSFSERGLEIALKVNNLFDGKAKKLAFRQFLNKHFPVKKYGKSLIFDDEAREKQLEIYKEDNEKLFATYMPEFPVDSYSSVEATKKLGPLFKEMKATKSGG